MHIPHRPGLHHILSPCTKEKSRNFSFSKLRLFRMPEGIRTPDPRLRRPLLYPTELRTHKKEPSLVSFMTDSLDPIPSVRRRDRIRTCDLSVPNRTLYQTEPHAVHSRFGNAFAFPKRIFSLLYAASFSFAVSASFANPAASLTAMSARILRFISIPASFKPYIKRL